MVVERGAAAAAELPADVVYAGASLGTLPAQALAQTRAGARAALLLFGGVPAAEFGTPWPSGVPLQIHTKAEDPFTEVDLVHGLVEDAGGELFLYPGSGHLFAEPGRQDYDATATRLLMARVLEFLDRAT